MYDEHFGLTGRPFQLTPDPAFWYETATHRRAMAYLGYGLAQGEGFIVITGDIGAGKTTLVGHLLATLDREALNPIKIVSTQIEASDLLRLVAGQLGVDSTGLEKAQLLVAIERGLHAVARSGRRTLLIVDEAQALPTAAVEELRMLSNFQAGGHALLQIVLLGQPEFRAALHGSERLEQLRQRVIAIHHLDPMGADEVAAYVRHRLAVVGWSGRPGFTDSAFAALHRLTDGVPRRLNQLCNRVMLHAAVEEVDLVTAATVNTVAADLFADLPTHGRPAGDLPAASGVVAPLPGPAEMVEAAPVMVAVAAPPVTPGEPGAELSDVDEEALAPASPVPDIGADVRSGEEEAAADSSPVAEQSAVVEAPASRPFRHSWLAAEAEPSPTIPDAVEAARAAAVAFHAAAAERVAAAAVQAPAAADPVALPAEDPATAERIAQLEARLDQQDAALRRVLTLLVDWVEGDATAKPVVDAAPAEPRGYAPIRGAAA